MYTAKLIKNFRLRAYNFAQDLNYAKVLRGSELVILSLNIRIGIIIAQQKLTL